MKVIANTVLILVFAVMLTVAFVFTNVYAGDTDASADVQAAQTTAQVVDEAGK